MGGQADRQHTDRHTEADRWLKRQTSLQADRWTDRQTHGWTGRAWTDRRAHRGRQTSEKTDTDKLQARWMDWQRDKHMGGWRDRQTSKLKADRDSYRHRPVARGYWERWGSLSRWAPSCPACATSLTSVPRPALVLGTQSWHRAVRPLQKGKARTYIMYVSGTRSWSRAVRPLQKGKARTYIMYVSWTQSWCWAVRPVQKRKAKLACFFERGQSVQHVFQHSLVFLHDLRQDVLKQRET